MALRAEIIGGDPGRAQLRLHGLTPEAGNLRIQIRRNQGPDTYLGGEGRWQSSPDFWFAIDAANRKPSADGIDIAIGPEIVDPIAASLGGNAFQLTLETSAGTLSAPLVIPQHPVLLASGAAGAPQRPAPEPTPAPAPPEPPPVPPAPPTTLKADPDRAPVERPTGGRFGLIVAVIVVILALAIGGFFFRDRVTPLLGGAEESPPQATAPAQGELEQIKTFLSENPNAPERLAKARESLAACQFNWASTLYRDLGQAGDPEAALAMGRIYDPTDPVCPAIGAPNRSLSSDTAGFWYDKAIAAKSVEAMRRKGLMLAASGKDAPKYQEGIDLLKQAAGQGDAEAAAKLKELGL
ncbi:hypothetical protein [Dongia sedimenti]|uniref:Sel1 repeat family protein n=1 Tax=Dongia sedimenti TaxID=3064282 RepID=A0ABU0YMH9_9PROT|nr:hypothetical protein [Rhodospirillaceae bacterium R-7]